MELISLRCASCGGVLSVQNVNDVAFCQFCGNKFIVANNEEAIKTVSVETDVDLIKKAKQLEAFNELYKAAWEYNQIINKFPHNLEALVSQLKLCTSNYQCAYLPIETDEALLINRIKVLDGENSSHLKPYNEILAAIEKYDQERLDYISNHPIEQDDTFGKKNPCKFLDYKIKFDKMNKNVRRHGYLGFIDAELSNTHWQYGAFNAAKFNEQNGTNILKQKPSSPYNQSCHNAGIRRFIKKYIADDYKKILKNEFITYNGIIRTEIVYLKDYTMIIEKGSKYYHYPLTQKFEIGF